MPIGAVALALAAAFAHAVWNLLVAGARDSSAATAVAVWAGVLAFLPVALITGGVHTEALPYAVASAALHLVYMGLLAAAYGRAELSLVYPLSRGAAPVLVLIASTVAGTALGAGEAIGVLVIAAGILMVQGLERPHDLRDIAFVAGVAICIAAYTLVDKEGVSHARPIAYLELVLGMAALVYLPLTLALGGRDIVRAELRPRILAAGLCMFGAYVLVLAALTFAPAAPVAAVRETSIVIATALAAVFLGERVTRTRMAGAVVVVAGIALLSLA
jgi:drug/metabolite transporter (DMT)-like permease